MSYEKKTFYISKLEKDKDNPKAIYSSDGKIWLRPDVYKEFISNTLIQIKKELEK